MSCSVHDFYCIYADVYDNLSYCSFVDWIKYLYTTFVMNLLTGILVCYFVHSISFLCQAWSNPSLIYISFQLLAYVALWSFTGTSYGGEVW